MTEPVIPELEEIRRIVLDELPMGHHLEGVDLTYGNLAEGQDPAFMVLIKVTEEPGADPGEGLAYEITRRIRERWSRDVLYVKMAWQEREKR